MALSSLLVQHQAATMRQVEEALARQVIYGGDLVTNLLEVAIVDEAVLVDLLATALQIPPAPAGELPMPSDAARTALPADWAAQTVSVPLELSGETLVLAVAEPLPAAVKEQLAASRHVHIEERAAPAVRIWQAISKAYGVRLERRMQRVIARLAGDEWAGATALAPPISSQRPAPASPSQVPAPDLPPLPRPVHGTVAGAATMRPASRRYSTLKTFPFERPSSSGQRGTAVLDTPPVVASDTVQRGGSLTMRPGQRHRGPLLLDEARAQAETSVDRDGLLGLAFDFARQFFEYTALFLVHGDIAEGRDGFGSGATRERVLGIGVPLDLPSLLARARESRIPFVGAVQPDGLDAVLLGDLQRPRNAEMAVVPIIVRTRAVALLVGDCGDAGIDRGSLRQITELCGLVSKAFERMIVRRKLEGFVAGALGSTSGRVQASLVTSKRGGASSSKSEPTVRASPPEQALGAEEGEAETPFLLRRGIQHGSSAPPAVNIATVRLISGPPIPREEPESTQNRDTNDVRRDMAPLRATQGGVQPVDEDMVLVDRISAGFEPNAEADLGQLADRPFAMLMARFPGPVAVARSRVATFNPPPPASECGPILDLVVRARRRALPYLLGWLTDPDAEKRGWAALILCEMPALEALPALRRSRGDPDAGVRAAALQAVESAERAFGAAIVDALSRFTSSDASPQERIDAMRIMGEAGEPATVPELIRGIGDDDEQVRAAAFEVLVRITCQDFGHDAKAWLDWWKQNGNRHRIEWLIDALVHSAAEIRRAAAEELRSQTRQYIAYSSDLPLRERERAQQRYRDWWITEGRILHPRP